MALSLLAQMFAAEIAQHDWSDSPFRADKAGHQRDRDGRSVTAEVLDPGNAAIVKLNVVWVVGQVLGYIDPNLDIWEFGEAAGVDQRFLRNKDGRRSRGMWYGLRHDDQRRFQRPGTFAFDPE